MTSQHWPDRAIGICFISNPGQLIFLSVKPWLQFHCEFFSNLLKRQAFDWMFCIMSSLTQLSWFCWADLDEFVQIIAPRCSDHLNWDAPEKRADQCVKPLEYERLNIYMPQAVLLTQNCLMCCSYPRSARGIFVIIINLFMSRLFSCTISVQFACPLCQTELCYINWVLGFSIVSVALCLWVYGLH